MDRRGEVSELRASPHLTASAERGRWRLKVVFASYAERSAGQARCAAVRRGRRTAAVPSHDRPCRRRHGPARRGLRTGGRLSDRAGPRHHLRHPGVGVPDRRPGQGLSGDRVRPPRSRPQRRAVAARELRPQLPRRRPRRRSGGDAGARRTCGHRGPLHGRYRDHLVGRALSSSRCRRDWSMPGCVPPEPCSRPSGRRPCCARWTGPAGSWCR